MGLKEDSACDVPNVWGGDRTAQLSMGAKYLGMA